MSKQREPDITFKWTNCCRLCLSQENTIDLFSEASISQRFPSKIRNCLNFLLYSGDPMPRKICSTCCDKLNSWCQFRKECIQTEKDLKRRLEPYKRINFVKEYFDKYMKYEKSSQDSSISFESMSEYEEDEDIDNLEIYSDYLQREDENSGLSESDKAVRLSCYPNLNMKISPSKLNDTHCIRNTVTNSDINVKEKETHETVKSTNNVAKVNIKNKAQEKEKSIVESWKRSQSAKDCKRPSNAEIGVHATYFESIFEMKSFESRKVENSVDNKKSSEEQNTSMKACPECGIEFPSEEHFTLHSCTGVDSDVESDDNENFINPLSLVDISLSEPNKEASETDCDFSNLASDSLYKAEKDEQKKKISIPWRCLVCNENFKTIIDLKDHYNSSISECSKTDMVMECEFCKGKFIQKNEFLDHQLIHLKSDIDEKSSFVVQCNKCDLQFDDETELKRHIYSHDPVVAVKEIKGEFLCLKCEQIFYDKELFEKHELIHNQQDIYNSIITPQFKTFEGIESIDDFADENEQFEEECRKPLNVVRCFRCGKIFNSSEELEQHELLKHKNPTPYFCRKCDLRFSARSQLLMHVRSHMRKSDSSNVADGGGSSDNTCSMCNAKFFSSSDLQSHMRMHKYSPTEELSPTFTQKSWQSPELYGDNKIDLFAKFKCSVCSKIFVHSGSIIRHGKNLHKGQAVYPVRLKRPIFLMKRAKSLTLPPEKNFKNPQVIKLPSYSNAAAINTNDNSQHVEDSCDMEMSQEGNWAQDSDVMKTDPNLEFGTQKCPFCEKVFKPTYLPRHIKRNHRGEVLDPQMLGKEIPDDSLICRYCLKSCSNPHNRRVHESIHYPVKMQCTQCKICGQKFYNKSSYEVHILSCKSVRCVKCNKIFFRYLSLKNHSCSAAVQNQNKA